MLHWLIEQRVRAQQLAMGESRINHYEDVKEVLGMLDEPIPGITRSERMAALEGESFMNVLNAMGG